MQGIEHGCRAAGSALDRDNHFGGLLVIYLVMDGEDVVGRYFHEDVAQAVAEKYNRLRDGEYATIRTFDESELLAAK